MTKSIVFVHGFMTTGACWTDWKDYFQAKGYTCYNPSWPYHDGDIHQLQTNPDNRLKDTDFQDVLNRYISVIETLDEQPILIGHSLGGALVQKLLELGYGVAGVCINSGPPKGVTAFNWDFLISNAQLINPLSSNPLRLMSPKWYHKYVTNEMSFEETKQFMAKNCVPASKKVATSLTTQGVIDFNAPHKPLLFISGDLDRSQPAAINLKNYQAYTDKTSITSYKEFKGRTHNSINQANWQEMADFIEQWFTKNGVTNH